MTFLLTLWFLIGAAWMILQAIFASAAQDKGWLQAVWASDRTARAPRVLPTDGPMLGMAFYVGTFPMKVLWMALSLTSWLIATYFRTGGGTPRWRPCWTSQALRDEFNRAWRKPEAP